MSTAKALLICDLDGTLVDSYLGIAESLKIACAAVGIEPVVPIAATLVGPPLDAMLAVVSGPRGEAFRRRFRQAFLDAYDGGGCVLAQPFEGIDDMLKSLSDSGIDLALATNKRHLPTAAIVRTCGWEKFFNAIEAADSHPGLVRTKTQMLLSLREAADRNPTGIYYLGDTEADFQAAQQAGVRFILAGWGYESRFSAPGLIIAPAPSSVCSRLFCAASLPKDYLPSKSGDGSFSSPVRPDKE